MNQKVSFQYIVHNKWGVRMYLDYIKVDYSSKSEKERGELINRDKNHLGKIIQDRITKDIEQIVDRWYKLDDIGLIDEEGAFSNLLKEAEELYSFGYYVGAISLIGVAAEELCKKISRKNSIDIENLTQFLLINLLGKREIINNKVKNKLHSIRKIRNKFIHANNEGIYKNDNSLIHQSLEIIKDFKEVLKNTFEVTELNYLDFTEKVISNQDISFIDFKYRYRNLLNEQNIDLQIDTSISAKVFTNFYSILEIDINSDLFKEMTLLDLNSGIPFVVDLTLPQVDEIKRLKLEEQNVIVASVLSKVSSTGQTEQWILLEIQQVYRGKIDFFQTQ